LCISTHIVSQTYDKPNTLILECEKYLPPAGLLRGGQELRIQPDALNNRSAAAPQRRETA